MKAEKTENDSVSHGSMNTSAIAIFGTIADTTWRMFVPVIGGVLLGLWLDTLTNSKPLYTFGGLVVGALVAVLLIRHQLRKVMGAK